MFQLKLGSARALRGFTIRLLVGLMLLSLFSSSLSANASASGGNVGPDGSPGWTYCADEGTTCAFPGTMEVRYWGYDDNSQTTIGYRTKVATNSIDCSTASFGGADPAFGVAKKCYYRSPQLDSGEITTTVSDLNKVVTVTFSVYAMQAGTTNDLKSKITVKKTSGGSYEPLGLNDAVVNATSTPISSTLEIYFENALSGADNAIRIESGAFVDGSGQLHNRTIEIDPIRFSPPALSPDVTDNYTVNDLEISFADDPLWRGAITAVENGASPLTEGTQFTVGPGIITIKAGVLAKGTHSLAIAATGYSNATVSQTVNKLYEGPQSGTGTSTDPFLIATAEQLDGVRTDMRINKHYRLIADIDLSGYPNWDPIGANTDPFYGHFDGDGHIISGLTINSGGNNVGLFGWTETTGSIKNAKLRDVNITGGSYVGGLVGNNGASVENCSVTGRVSGANYVGGLFGGSSVREISNSFSSADVSGMNSIGGLAGTFNGTLRYSYATGNVSGKDAGGLVGTSNYGEIVHSFATGNVTGINSSEIGGLVGVNYYGKVSYSYASGMGTGAGDVGGLIGLNYYGEINDSYASSAVSGHYSVGGLIGYNDNSVDGEIRNSYASGSVNGKDEFSIDLGGLIGKSIASDITNSFYDAEATGQSASGAERASRPRR
ncbi:GLUG motif-containing protein [Cohnella cholangitidis]|nr:GLUG motif-containing protein [Cohnella cholangitidis]